MDGHARLDAPRLFAALLIALGLSGCGNTCLDMCQQYERYLDRCGYGWTTAFHDRGWRTIEDCYDEYWETAPEEHGVCEVEAREYSERACY